MTATPRVEAKTVLVADDTAFVRDRLKAIGVTSKEGERFNYQMGDETVLVNTRKLTWSPVPLRSLYVTDAEMSRVGN